MAIIRVDSSQGSVPFSLGQGRKTRIVQPGFTGATYLVATCVAPGTSGAIEPAWDQFLTGQEFTDGTVMWRVVSVPNRSSMPYWQATTAYYQGQQIVARAVRSKLDSVQSTAPHPFKNWSRRFPHPDMFLGTPLFHSRYAQATRTWLSRIWKDVLTGSDRSDWGVAAGFANLVSFKGFEKVFTAWECFQYANFYGGPGYTIVGGRPRINTTLPTHATLPPPLLYATTKAGTLSAVPQITSVAMGPSGSFTVTFAPALTHHSGQTTVFGYGYASPRILTRGVANRPLAFVAGFQNIGSAPQTTIFCPMAAPTHIYFPGMSSPREWRIGFRVLGYFNWIASPIFTVTAFF